MIWLLPVLANALTPTPTAPDVRGDAASGFELRVGAAWLPLPVAAVEGVAAYPIGDRFLVVEKAYDGGSGSGCEQHTLSVVEVREGQLLRRPQPSIDLGRACWSRNEVSREPRPSVEVLVTSPFLAPVVVDASRFDLVHTPVALVRPSAMGLDLKGRVHADSMGPWTVDGERVPGP